MEVYNVEKSDVSTDVAVRTSSWSSDDNRHMEFFSIHMLDSNFVRRHDKSLVVHLLDPAIKRCSKGVLCSFGVQYRYGKFLSSYISKPTELTKLA